MTPRAQERSAFCTLRSIYYFKRTPFGLSNAPATFCRLMHRVLKDHLWRICLCYLDDVIIYAKSQRELFEKLHTILLCLHNVGLKVKHSKFSLFKERIFFLDHMVSAAGIDPQEEKIRLFRTGQCQSVSAMCAPFSDLRLITVSLFRISQASRNHFRHWLKRAFVFPGH